MFAKTDPDSAACIRTVMFQVPYGAVVKRCTNKKQFN